MNVRVRLALIAIAAMVVVPRCGGKSAGAEGQGLPPVTVKIGLVETRTIRATTEYVAQLRSRRSIDVQPQVEGHVRSIFIRPGQRVEAGTLIMQIDPAKQLESVRGFEASRASRVAALRLAQQQETRIKGLFASGVASRQDLDQAESNLAAAKADVSALDAQVSSEKVQLRYYDIAAPAAGIIGDIPVREGDYVTSSTRLTTIDQNSELEAYLNVPIERAVELRPGLPVELLDQAGNVVAEGKVDFIAPRVSDTTQSLVVKAPISNVRGGMRAAQFMSARLIWSSRQSPVVPTTAVTRLGGQPFVFVADAEGKSIVAHQKNVELGELSGDVYEIRSGVRAGDRVVVSGAQKLQDGGPIVPESQTAPAEKR